MLASNEEALCNLLFIQFDHGRNFVQIKSDFPEQFTNVPWPWDDPILIDVDINNDGFSDLIRKGIEDVHGIDHAVVMVRDGRDRDGQRADPPKTFDQRLLYSGETLFPTNRLGGAVSKENRDFATIITPFIWQNKTYVLMHAYFRGYSPT